MRLKLTRSWLLILLPVNLACPCNTRTCRSSLYTKSIDIPVCQQYSSWWESCQDPVGRTSLCCCMLLLDPRLSRHRRNLNVAYISAMHGAVLFKKHSKGARAINYSTRHRKECTIQRDAEKRIRLNENRFLVNDQKCNISNVTFTPKKCVATPGPSPFSIGVSSTQVHSRRCIRDLGNI